jgi:hypothetical protein
VAGAARGCGIAGVPGCGPHPVREELPFLRRDFLKLLV